MGVLQKGKAKEIQAQVNSKLQNLAGVHWTVLIAKCAHQSRALRNTHACQASLLQGSSRNIKPKLLPEHVIILVRDRGQNRHIGTVILMAQQSNANKHQLQRRNISVTWRSPSNLRGDLRFPHAETSVPRVPQWTRVPWSTTSTVEVKIKPNPASWRKSHASILLWKKILHCCLQPALYENSFRIALWFDICLALRVWSATQARNSQNTKQRPKHSSFKSAAVYKKTLAWDLSSWTWPILNGNKELDVKYILCFAWPPPYHKDMWHLFSDIDFDR